MISSLRTVGGALQGTLGLLSCGWLAVMFFRTWQTPLEVEGGAWVRFGFAILGLELLLNLAGIFLTGISDTNTQVVLNGIVLNGDRKRKVKRRLMVVLFLVFTIIGVAIALAVDSHGLLFGFLGLMISRGIGLRRNQSKSDANRTSRFAVNLAMFMVILLATSFLPLSPGGLTHDVLAQVYPNRGSGILAEHPERVIIMGMIYFSSVGLVELVMGWRLREPES